MAQLEITFTTGKKVLLDEDTPIETFDKNGNFIDRHTIYLDFNKSFSTSFKDITENVTYFIDDDKNEKYFVKNIVNYSVK